MIIAISGLAGTGKTTLAHKLKETLSKKYKVEIHTPTLREIAKKEGKTLEEIQREAEKNPKIDIILDNTTKEKVKNLEKENDIVISSSWLSIYLFPNALKIFLTAPLEVRATRIAKRDNTTKENAIQKIKERENQNNLRWKKLYNITLDDLQKLAHITLNTAYLSIDEEVKIISAIVEERLKIKK